MWTALINANQLHENSRLKQTILEGDFRHESIYQLTRLGEHFFMLKYIEQNGILIPNNEQLVTPYRINGVPHYGFEIFTE